MPFDSEIEKIKDEFDGKVTDKFLSFAKRDGGCFCCI